MESNIKNMSLLSLDEVRPESLEQKSDEELLNLSLSSPEVFGLLIDRYEKAFLRKAAYLLGVGEEIKDVTQDALVKIYINAPKFKPENGSFQSWAYKILINTCLAHYNQRKRWRANVRRLPEAAEAMVPDQQGLMAWEKKLDHDYLLSLLSLLPVALAKLIKWRFIEMISDREIARREGISAGAVRTRIYRAKVKLKKLAANLPS